MTSEIESLLKFSFMQNLVHFRQKVPKKANFVEIYYHYTFT